ncbi:MAG TPA: FHA domain-containing protein [Solirubrobacteraceae bacterium]|nr:FHA domain-containing protein [Solirubrobacteraceae bacterium]
MSRPPTIQTGAEPRRSRVAQSPAELKEVIAAERTGHSFLVWRTDEGEQRLLLLDQQRWRVTVGRDSAADLPLAWDAEVSRTHALLEQVGRGWTVVDDGLSRNGSFVNGERVIGRRRLRDKDRMVFGATTVTFRETPSGGITQTASAIDAPATIPLTPMQRKVLIALCRPVHDSASAIPATNRQIAEEVYLTVDAVKAHLRVLFERYGLSQLPQNEKRTRLVASVLDAGVLAPRDF